MNTKWSSSVAFLMASVQLASCDVYMQCPPGGNNRLDEGGGNRNNNNRLMDTQNNAKGGYGYGGNAANQAEPVSYYVGSKLEMTWTAQHSCGGEKAECQIVIDKMCNDDPAGVSPPGGPWGPNAVNAAGTGEGPLRDGTDGNTPDPNNPNGNRGLHEPTSFYQACAARERNQGLYTADQNLNNNRATRTRQNPNGARSGLECAEERDYYPYWAPSPWQTVMVMTNNLAMCPIYQQESQNVKPRGYCSAANGNGDVPWSQQGCAASGGTWTETSAFNIPAPECVAAPITRDNHLGNDKTGEGVKAVLTIPGGNEGAIGTANAVDASTACVFRLRYNITTADTRACSLGKQYATKEACTAALGPDGSPGIWSAFFLDSSYNDATLASTPPLPEGNPDVDPAGTGNGGGTDSLLELAINTNQYGRTFQDRTHVFAIKPRPASVPANVVIHNLNWCGKRGNIVQTYPAEEYRPNPTDLVAGAADMIHVQWTGNDNTNNNGNNNGEGTNNEDRHNIVQESDNGMNVPVGSNQASMFDVAWELNPEPSTSVFGGARSQAELTKQFALSKQQNCAAGNPGNDQARNNCQKLNSAAATVDLGLIRFKPGQFKYMSSRNNNFSNRAAKGSITVTTDAHVTPKSPTNVTATVLPGGSPDRQSLRVTWMPPGDNEGYVGTDGKIYAGKKQEAREVAAYSVQFSIDGGATWDATNCEISCEPPNCYCDIPPELGRWNGQTVAVRVRSRSSGGYSEPSPMALALPLKAAGDLSDGATAAVALAAIAGVALILFMVWIFSCGGMAHFSKAPPPPPVFKGPA